MSREICLSQTVGVSTSPAQEATRVLTGGCCHARPNRLVHPRGRLPPLPGLRPTEHCEGWLVRLWSVWGGPARHLEFLSPTNEPKSVQDIHPGRRRRGRRGLPPKRGEEVGLLLRGRGEGRVQGVVRGWPAELRVCHAGWS